MPGEQMMQAAREGNLEAVLRIAADDPSLVGVRIQSGETPLMAALYRGHHEVVAALVDAGAPLDIFAAAALGRLDALELRLAERIDCIREFAYDGWTALHLAAFFGHGAVVRRLVAAGADMRAISKNSIRNTPLHAAVAGGHVAPALWLIEQGADVNAADGGGHTPLHIAAEAGYVPVVKALLDRGADAHAVDGEDKTPLSRAAARHHTAVVDLINVRE